MKNYLLLLSLLFTAFSFSACQKELSIETGATGTVDTTIKVKTYTEAYTTDTTKSSITYNVLYDASNRIVGLTSAINPGNRLVYTYVSTTKYTLDLYNADTLNIHEDLYNNTSAFLDTTFQYDNLKDTVTEKYFYNASNQVIQMNEYDFINNTSQLINTISYSYNADGDLLSAAGTDRNVDTYTYYTDASYVTPLNFGPPNANSSKRYHLIKTYTLTSNGTLVGTASYTYTFDSSNRINTETATLMDGSTLVKSYTYY